MSENKPPKPSSESQNAPSLSLKGEASAKSASEPLTGRKTGDISNGDISSGDISDRGIGPAVSRSESQLESEPQPDIWETVSLPGTLSGEAIAAAIDQPKAMPEGMITQERENELLTLIHDLNECNDALLARTSQLEATLETSRLAWEAELEKAKATQAKMASQITAEQVAAQQAAQNAQQQVAKLVSQLDSAEQTCSRQRLINENLQTELSNRQERIIQLEHECALTTQQHATEAQARIKAETTSRDLRSRLQRQQRYTLQFKAALEKSLSVSARPASAETTAESVRPISFKESVAMPKAQRIMPWVAGSVSAFTGIDPHLETLIRGVSKSAEASEATEATTEASDCQSAADREAEAVLWQDLERVMIDDSEVTVLSVPEDETATVESAQKSPALEGSAAITSPQLNWQAQAKAVISKAAVDKVAAQSPHELSQSAQTPSTSTEDATAMAPDVAQSFAAATGQPSNAEIGFTEPSPWGMLSESLSAPQPTENAVAEPAQAAALPPTGYMPVVDDTAAVSPLVRPMRSPKKLSSLSAVQLPTFEKAKAGSFRR